MPREDYDDEYDDDGEYEDVEEIEEVDDDDDEIEDADEVAEVDEVEEMVDKGRRQLRRGRLSEFSDKLTGGAARPGEEDVKRSPFVMVMAGTIIALALISLIVGFMILSATEERSFTAAKKKLDEESFKEAEDKYQKFLEVYPKGEYANRARIDYHTAKVKQYTDVDKYNADDVENGLREVNELISNCRDLEGFAEQRENVYRYAERLARVGAIVAEAKRNPKPLENSEAAMKLMGQFAGPDGVPISTQDDIRALQNKASAAILKQNVLKEALAEINGHLENGDTFAALESRQALLDRYSVLTDDEEVGKVLTDILTREKELASSSDVGKDSIRQDNQAVESVAATLTLRTQINSELVSEGRYAFAMGLESCFGLDSDTGTPLWKRKVGGNAPFAPITVNASQPALLVFHTGTSELQLLAQKDGSLIWRQSIPARPSGPPLIFEQQIYLTTTNGEIWRLSVDTGKAISKVKFNQPVIGPPAVTRDKQFMVIPGDQSVVYTLTINPLECVAVSYVEHRLGSVEAPILTMGKVLLMCDNDIAEKTRLRVLAVNESTGDITVRYTDESSVAGQVRDACLLRGTDLFVPSSPQTMTAFSVNDDPDADPPIAWIGSNQPPDPSTTRVHLHAGSGGQVWMASDGLWKFRVRTNALELEPESAAQGLHLQPIQALDQKRVYVTTNEPYSSSVFFTLVDPGEMTGQWRTVVGTNIVAAGPTDGGDQMLLVGDFGLVFRVPIDKIRSGGFVLDSLTSYQLPPKLTDQVGGLRINDGRVAAYCRGEDPKLWTFTKSGQLERMWPLPAEPTLPPVSLGNAVVFAMEGRLHCAGVSGTRRVEDYRAAQGIGEKTTWKSITALSDNQVLAINSKNEAIRVELRSTPRPNLLYISSTRLQDEIELQPTADGDLLIAVTSEGSLQVMSAATLEILGQTPLGGQPGQPAIVAGDRIFVDVARQELRIFERSASLKQTGSLNLDGRFLVGTPVQVRGGGYVICLSDGEVMLLDADGNATEKTRRLGQAAKSGPLVIGNSLVVISNDGSLYAVEDILN